MTMHAEHLVVQQLACQGVAAEEKRAQRRTDHDVDAPDRPLCVCWVGRRAGGQRRVERKLCDLRVSRREVGAMVVAMHSSQHDVCDSHSALTYVLAPLRKGAWSPPEPGVVGKHQAEQPDRVLGHSRTSLGTEGQLSRQKAYTEALEVIRSHYLMRYLKYRQANCFRLTGPLSALPK